MAAQRLRRVAVTHVFNGLPDLVVSGINREEPAADVNLLGKPWLARSQARDWASPASACRCARRGATTDCQHAAHAAEVLRRPILREAAAHPYIFKHQRAKRGAERLRVTIQATRNTSDVGRRRRSKGFPYYWYSKKARTTGSRRSVGTIRHARTAKCDYRANGLDAHHASPLSRRCRSRRACRENRSGSSNVSGITTSCSPPQSSGAAVQVDTVGRRRGIARLGVADGAAAAGRRSI